MNGTWETPSRLVRSASEFRSLSRFGSPCVVPGPLGGLTGVRPESKVLRHIFQCLFDNALPEAYGTIRQAVRRAGHASFAAHFADYLSAVKAEVDSRRARQVHLGFAGFVPQQPGHQPLQSAIGKGAGKGKGKGRGKGGGRKAQR